MPVKRKRIRQVVFKREDVDSTAETLAQGDVNAIAIFEPAVAYDNPGFERAPAQATLSKLETISGAKLATLSFGTDLKGGGALNTEPGVGKLFEACGFLKLVRTLITVDTLAGGPFKLGEIINGGTSNAIGIVLRDLSANGTMEIFVRTGTFASGEVITGATSGATANSTSTEANAGFAYMPHSRNSKTVTIGAVTGGPFASGEEIVGGTSSAKGYVIHDTETGRTQLYYIPSTTTNFASGETITGSRSGATATTSSVASCANPTSSYTFESREDGIIKKIKGARGKFTLTIGRVGEPGRVNFEFQGSPIDPIDGNLFNDTNDGLLPPKLLSAVFLIGAFTPKINSFEIQVENTLSPRTDVTDASGYLGVLISDRAISGSCDPEMTEVASKDWFGEWFGDTKNSFRTTIGSTPGNIIDIHSNNIKFNSYTR